jgi:hypothetical protein
MNNNQINKSNQSFLFENYFPTQQEIELDPKINFNNGMEMLRQNIPNKKNSLDIHLLHKGSNL